MTGVILMYHRVAIAPDDAYGIAVSPANFVAQMEYLRRLRCVVPLIEVLKPATALQVAITFDDGYADNATTAAPVLAGAGLPATYFITTATLGGQHFWWDRLAAGLQGAYAKPNGVDICVGGRDLWLALNSGEACRASLSLIHRRLRALPPDELHDTLDVLLKRLGAPVPSDDARTISSEQLRALSRLPGVEIGAHTRTHVQLKGQSPDRQLDEVVGSMSDLATALGQPVVSFAYPFGGQSAVGELAPRLAREAGCRVACTTDHAPVVRRSDPHRLPRLNVRDWDAETFAHALDEVARRR